MNLKKLLEQKEQASNQPIPPQYMNSVPTFDKKGNVIGKKSTKTIVAFSVISVFTILILSCVGLVYLPQFFMEEYDEPDALIMPNHNVISVRADYIKENPTEDFDGDGLTNEDEIALGSNIYDIDTDKDGLTDDFDSKPIEYTDDIYYAMTAQGLTTNSAYTMNGVIMWADDKSSFAHGGVMKSIDGGYYFSDFKGWAKFPDEGDAYLYENGTHTKLEYKEDEKAWYIPGDSYIVISEKEPEYIFLFSFFGKTKYLKGNFGKFINFILPQKGFITCQEMWLDDTFIDTSNRVIAKNKNVEFDEKHLERFSSNDTELKELMNVYRCLAEGDSLLVSLFDDVNGETVLLIYGYNQSGHLLVSTLDDNNKGVIAITPRCTKQLSKGKIIIQREWFDFDGCGYSSKSGDTICFFAASTKDSNEENSQQESVEPIEPIYPENGTYTEDEQIYYYIDGIRVTDAIIRFNNKGVLSYSRLGIKGSFYVDKNGIKHTGTLAYNEKQYYYQDDFIAKEFVINYNTMYDFSSSIPENMAALLKKGANITYYGSHCYAMSGWFEVSGNMYYASKRDYHILSHCFVYADDGELRYLGNDGTIVSDSTVTISDKEIVIDENGLIINFEECKNEINQLIRE